MSNLRMMMIALALAGCTKVPGTGSTDDTRNRQGIVAPDPAAPAAKVTLMSVTFGDDCGGTAPTNAPARVEAPPGKYGPAASMPAQDSAARPSDEAPGAAYRYRCEQTSMQLSIAANRDSNVEIKSVEVLDESGKSLGSLAASKPTRWSDARSAYEAWDQKVATKQTALVSYVLSQPGFVNRYDSHDRMFTVKVTASVGGVAQSLQTTVMVVAQHAPVPT